MYLSVKQVIEKLNGAVGKTLLYRLVDCGAIKATRLGKGKSGKVLIDWEALLEYLDGRTNQTPKPVLPKRGKSGARVGNIELW